MATTAPVNALISTFNFKVHDVILSSTFSMMKTDQLSSHSCKSCMCQ